MIFGSIKANIIISSRKTVINWATMDYEQLEILWISENCKKNNYENIFSSLISIHKIVHS